MTDELDEKFEELEDRLEDSLEFKLLQHSNEFNNKINILKEDLSLWNKFISISIPYTYERFLKNSISFLESETIIPKFIKEYRKTISPKNDKPSIIKGSQLNNEEFRQELIIDNTTFLRNARSFYELGKNTTIDIKPILLYYSTINLYSFFIRTLVRYHPLKPVHGLTLRYNEDKNIEIKIKRYGFFNRLVLTLSFFSYSSIFSDHIFDYRGESNENIIIHKNNHKFIKIEKGFLLKELLELKLEKESFRFNSDDYYHKIYNMESRFTEASKLLKDFILLFVSSHLARYNPTKWKEIYDGEKSNYFIPIQSSFDSINHSINFISNEFQKIKSKKPDRFSTTFKDIF